MGSKLYIKRKPEDNVIFGTFGCIFVSTHVIYHGDFINHRIFFALFKYALRKKYTLPSSDNAHWLDRASNKYSQMQISDTKSALGVLYIFIGYPIFWALYEQQVNFTFK